jgi:hypothetical protein
MNKYKTFHLIAAIFVSSTLYSQEYGLMIPREVSSAVDKQTRTLTGIPGTKYWQNEIDYRIEAGFDPQTGKISGRQTIVYTNKSPQSLYMLVFNLYPNLFKKGNPRDRAVEPEDVHDGISISKISVDGIEIDGLINRAVYEGTRFNLYLPRPLASNSKTTVVMEWEFNLPSKTKIRIGNYGPNTWFIGYWYPQIAVFDDLYGWDEIDYDGLHEFYSPFANFDVQISVPAKQIIWATGIWQNPEKILEDNYLKRYNQAMNSESVVNIVKAEDLTGKITKQADKHIWHYKAENVTDFCFATSHQYLWDGVSYTPDKTKNKKIFIQAAYNKSSRDFYEVAEISKKTIHYLSTVMPAVPFPYPRMTVFNGDGGMEFPMMVNDRSEISRRATVNLTSHEIAHSYFPFYMGINQERFSWMDEGWAQFLPAEFQEMEVPNNKQAVTSSVNYAYYAGTGLEMPMMVPSHFVKGYEYYIASYYRPEIAFRVLQHLLGKGTFLKGLQEFIYRWNGKYPGPYDFFFTFNDVAKQDLSWFWKPWFFEIAYPDLGIKSVKKENKIYLIEIENTGRLPLPLELEINYTDGSKTQVSKTAEIWKDGKMLYEIRHESMKEISRCRIGADWIPDANFKNNQY